jgi:hypothetical protein
MDQPLKRLTQRWETPSPIHFIFHFERNAIRAPSLLRLSPLSNGEKPESHGLGATT